MNDRQNQAFVPKYTLLQTLALNQQSKEALLQFKILINVFPHLLFHLK